VRHRALQILIASVVTSAIVGIAIVLTGEFGETETKVMLTTLCLSGASILAMACVPAWERRRLMPVPPYSLFASIVGMSLYILFVWVEPGTAPAPWQISTTFVILGVAGAHASLLALADPAPQHRWARTGAYLSGAALALVMVILLWGEPAGSAPQRVLGTLAILVVAFTLLVPVLRRTAERTTAADAFGEPHARLRHCPACGARLGSPPRIPCRSCGAEFEVLFPG
jgi:hypothetical protein